jgi:Glycosyltransferase family 87
VSSNDVQPVPEIWPKSRRRLLCVFALGMLWFNLLFFFRTREGIKRGYPDFTIFYTAGTILREGLGRQLYSRDVQYEIQQRFAGHIAFRQGPLPYNHPPFEAPLFVPLTLLPYPQAFAAWDLMNVAALFGVAWLLRRSVGALHLIPPWKFVLGSIAFNPVFACLFQGQDSILMLLFCALSFNALKKKADLLGGGWLALAAFKFQFIVPIVLLLFIWRRRRVALGFGAVALVLALISLGLVGVGSMLQYPGYVLQIAKTPSLGGVPAEFLPNLHGLATGWPGPLSGGAGAALAALTSIMVFLFAAWKGRPPAHPAKLELQFSLAIVVSGLIAWQTNAHDLSLLVLPLVFITDHCLQSTTPGTVKRFDLLLPTLPLLISPLWLVLWLGIAKVNLMAIPLLWWTWKIGKEFSRDPDAAACPVA